MAAAADGTNPARKSRRRRLLLWAAPAPAPALEQPPLQRLPRRRRSSCCCCRCRSCVEAAGCGRRKHHKLLKEFLAAEAACRSPMPVSPAGACCVRTTSCTRTAHAVVEAAAADSSSCRCLCGGTNAVAACWRLGLTTCCRARAAERLLWLLVRGKHQSGCGCCSCSGYLKLGRSFSCLGQKSLFSPLPRLG